MIVDVANNFSMTNSIGLFFRLYQWQFHTVEKSRFVFMLGRVSLTESSSNKQQSLVGLFRSLIERTRRRRREEKGRNPYSIVYIV